MERAEGAAVRLADTAAGSIMMNQWTTKLGQHFELPEDFKDSCVKPIFSNVSVREEFTASTFHSVYPEFFDVIVGELKDLLGDEVDIREIIMRPLALKRKNVNAASAGGQPAGAVAAAPSHAAPIAAGGSKTAKKQKVVARSKYRVQPPSAHRRRPQGRRILLCTYADTLHAGEDRPARRLQRRAGSLGRRSPGHRRRGPSSAVGGAPRALG
mmetsp:Transcript_16628/g.45256  ORF Transcript_16628/g.45256 Transcript_16628/m.45256 type:complete len:212 (-) Transcript_16628:764-1399(-)